MLGIGLICTASILLIGHALLPPTLTDRSRLSSVTPKRLPKAVKIHQNMATGKSMNKYNPQLER